MSYRKRKIREDWGIDYMHCSFSNEGTKRKGKNVLSAASKEIYLNIE
jgi:hypothetical protein